MASRGVTTRRWVGSLLVITSWVLVPISGCGLLPLVASAGPDKSVVIGNSIVLDGAATGGAGDYTYDWTPTTSLSATDIAQPTFTPTLVGVYTFTLTVTDADGATATDTVTVSATTNNAPVVADAGPDRSAAVGLGVTLQGSATGGNGTYAYLWGPATGLSDATAAQPTFTPTAEGTTTFTLTVTDGEGVSDTDTVDVTASTATVLTSLTRAANFGGGGYSIIAVFDQDLDKTTAETVTNYRIAGSATNPTAATLADDNHTVTLVFTAAITNTTTFDLSVNNGIQDANGNPVPAVTALNAAQNEDDSTAPLIASLTWAANYAGSYQLTIVFSEAMDRASTETKAAYRINGQSTTASAISLANDGLTATVTFDNVPLSTTSKIDVSVGNVLQDVNGNALALQLARPVSANTADDTAPTVSAIQHAANFTGDGYEILIEFNEALSETDVQNTTGYRIGVHSPTSATLGTDGRTVTLVFETPLTTANKLDVSVGNRVKDINGNALSVQSAQTISPAADTTAPAVATRTWANGYAGPGYQVLVAFNESLDKTTTEVAANWQITGGANPTAISLGNDGKTVTLTFSSALATTDTLDISVVNTLADINGNVLSAQTSQAIAANASDVTGPTIASREWGANQTTYQAIVTFSEVVDETTAETVANYTLAGNAGADSRNPNTATLAADGKTVTLVFNTTVAGFIRTDTLTVGAAVVDINGQSNTSTTAVAMSANGSDAAVPTATVADGPGANEVTVTFNEVVDKTTAETLANYVHDPAGAANAATAATLQANGLDVIVAFGAATPASTDDVRVSVGGSILDINSQAKAQEDIAIP